MKVKNPVQLVADCGCSLMIGKSTWLKVYGPFAVMRRLHVVFPGRSKSAWVDKPMAKWIVDNYAHIHYATEPDPVPEVVEISDDPRDYEDRVPDKDWYPPGMTDLEEEAAKQRAEILVKQSARKNHPRPKGTKK